MNPIIHIQRPGESEAQAVLVAEIQAEAATTYINTPYYPITLDSNCKLIEPLPEHEKWFSDEELSELKKDLEFSVSYLIR